LILFMVKGNEHHGRRPVKKKTHTAHFSIMVNNAIEIAVKLPGNNVFGPFKAKRLTHHQRQNLVCRKPVVHFINHDLLVGAPVPGDGIVIVSGFRLVIKSFKKVFIPDEFELSGCIVLFVTMDHFKADEEMFCRIG